MSQFLSTQDENSVLSSSVVLKVCTACKLSKQHTDFHLKGKDKTGCPRYQSKCKDCANAKRKQRYKAKQKVSKSTKRFQLVDSDIHIVFNKDDATDQLTEIMSDYVEAVYAIPIPSSSLHTKD